MVKKLTQSLIICIFYTYTFSCADKLRNTIAPVKTDTFKMPVINIIRDSTVKMIDTCPSPVIIKVPEKAGSFYLRKKSGGDETIQLSPPAATIADFFSTMQNYNSEQGLALSTINCAYTDKKGNLWFGTGGGGVSRYDGKSFTNFTTEQGLANNNVWGITEDRNGNLWFGTAGGGVSRYDGKSFTNFTTAQGLANDNLWDIKEDRKGNIWFATNGGGVSRYDGKSFTNFTTAQGLANNEVWCIMEDAKGNLWFGTNGGGVSRYDGKSFTNFAAVKGLNSNSVHCITEDKKGNVWMGTIGGGASMFDGKSFTAFTTANGLSNNTVWSMHEDKQGDLWLGTNGGGVCKYDGRNFTKFTTAQGLSNNIIWSITADKAENLWFATDGNGVSRYDGSSFISFTTAQGLPNNTVWSVANDASGNLWIATDKGACKYDGKSFTSFAAAQGFSDNTVLSITRDRNENFWFGTNGEGASKYDGKSFTHFTTAQGLTNNSILCSLEDDNGNIWFGTNGGGVSKYDGKSFTSFTMAQGLPSNNISCMAKDQKGNLWFGTNGGGTGGICRYDGQSFTNFTTVQGLSNNNIYCIESDKKGNLWFGTDGGGISVLRKSSMDSLWLSNGTINTAGKKTFFENYTKDDGLADNTVYDIIEDNNNNIVVGTNLGFTILKGSLGESKKTFAANGIEYFNQKNGYPLKDINTNAMYADHNNILWAGTGEGKLIRFDYAAIHRDSTAPNIIIHKVKINNEDIPWNDLIIPNEKNQKTQQVGNAIPLNIVEETMIFNRKLTAIERDSIRNKFSRVQFDSISAFYPVPTGMVLPYKNNNITFEFSAIEPSKSQFVHYRFMLKGYNSEWSQPSAETATSFGNMYEGNYTFLVQAQSPEGIWSTPLTYTFSVLPPWYRAWWAYTLYIIFLTGFVLLLIAYRSSRLQRENKILEEKVSHRTQQLDQSLQELKSTQAQLIQHEKLASLGQLTAGIAHEIQNPLNFVNNFSEVNKELVDELQKELKAGNTEEAIAISNDIKENEEKINHHGKRADAIVKGMLQHSKKTSGQKEPTDINALANEYLRLIFNGMRAKDKNFNAVLNTDFDESIGLINIIPQDISRVLLNLYNNAFYAVNEKKVSDIGYQPTVSVSTRKTVNSVTISVNDNGTGIPQNIVDKIFQPFFTTKPTGQGTGLGLSLSYDIIKAHGGEIKVDTPPAGRPGKENDGTTFIIHLPIVNQKNSGSDN